MPYEQYLQTPEWHARRTEALRRALYRCQLCNSPQPPLEAHHRTYDRQGAETPEDLTVLCSRCHLWHHRQPDAPAGRA
jgi:5-methylcytosine-specific restriction endonuclease McrA